MHSQKTSILNIVNIVFLTLISLTLATAANAQNATGFKTEQANQSSSRNIVVSKPKVESQRPQQNNFRNNQFVNPYAVQELRNRIRRAEASRNQNQPKYGTTATRATRSPSYGNGTGTSAGSSYAGGTDQSGFFGISESQAPPQVVKSQFFDSNGNAKKARISQVQHNPLVPTEEIGTSIRTKSPAKKRSWSVGPESYPKGSSSDSGYNSGSFNY